jgi:UDP-N-acetylglucosamine 4-epimerase
MLIAAREAPVKKFVYASSSSIYGDHPALPKVEKNIGKPLSPYALAKHTNEVLALLLVADHEVKTMGLRYFNVFGKRQNAGGEYAAAIPKFIQALARMESPVIYGDGETTRDFCYIDNVVDANILAALVDHTSPTNNVFNIAVGEQTSLNELFRMLQDIVAHQLNNNLVRQIEPVYQPFRPGDIRHSLAEISLAKNILGYVPTVRVREGLERMVAWMLENGIVKD